MRSGGSAVQQTLTAEAASVLKHSLSLARRRGHAQVTPLHVAATLLSSRTSLLRRACLKSQPHQTSHPLQCRALELCFNVALNRLPTTPGPLLHGQPSLSNALIAALKRAQAHQRRGCIEQQQQQPLLTVKVELEQLIISILDDPSVSRVMREAGFSSSNVKNNLEDSSTSSVFQCYSSSGGVFSSPCSPSPPSDHHHQNKIVPVSFWQPHFLAYTGEQNPLLFSPQKAKPPLIISNPTAAAANDYSGSSSKEEDVKLVLEVLVRKKRRNTVIVGDSASMTEGLVSEVMGRIERGVGVPEELKSTQFIKFQFSPVSVRFMKREDVEANLSELKRKVDSSFLGERGAIIYTGDLKWVVSDEDRDQNQNTGGYYSPVEHLVSQIARLVSSDNSITSSKGKVWVMGTASYQTHMRCQIRQPPLESQWCLQAVSVPSGGLGLSLHACSVQDSRLIISQKPSELLETKPIFNSKEQYHNNNKLTCCQECISNYEKESQLLKSDEQKLPAWLKPHGTEPRQKDEVAQLRKKWNSLCCSLHQGRHAAQNNLSSSNLYDNQSVIGNNCSYASAYPWWSTKNGFSPDPNSISFGHDPASELAHGSSLVPRFRRQQSCMIEFNFDNGVQKNQVTEPSLDSLVNTEGKELKITLALGNSVFSGSEKVVERKCTERTMQRADICKLLKENVPWQSESIPSIVEAIFNSKTARQETWLLIQGNDSIGKRRLAHAIAELVLGSADSLLHIDINKNENEMNPRVEVVARALKSNEKLVVLVEDVDLADTQFLKFLADGFENRKFGEVSRSEGIQSQAIFILAKSDSTRYDEEKAKYRDSIIQMALKVDEKASASPSFRGVNFDHKRKAEWELQIKTKSSRSGEQEDPSVVAVENVNNKEVFSRQSSFNTLDLNLKAGEDDEIEDKAGELSPNSSDLTRETNTDLETPHGFLESIENVIVFNRSPARDREATELFLSKIEGCFGEVYGKLNVVRFSVDKRVLEGVCIGSGYFPNSLFEKWLKDIFQKSLRAVKLSGKEGILVRLCLGDKEDGILEGFLGSCLPMKIHIY
ncbi:protein SMAX1-LIKE 4-like [Pyrus communis]|uniref:protein SMAX1-LIKE 4-like n=1 Tax=Pyrus communis TaxID=23211 RepID=UPI0035BF7B8F